ncbi:helix-turn-helix domain-containing protein [Paenibacillus wulumuqiensis]|uniref:helix-turn-helix domain-containing protein n=1 Tax=Paenibacillus wulumuqiensis TaxID=1567107 RepID=UPI000619A590|nr:helix-turn-helix domain-containing protein [Paenibacillus wulumuqiensis]
MRILIVDDEVIIRTGLASVIPWHELGLELLEPAGSAEEALERMVREQPHILLTDIRMTGKTGLELAEEARILLPELEIIILSGYDDFSYAQQAIRQHVADYLLKTSPPEEIIKTVLGVKRSIEQRLSTRHHEREIHQQTAEQLFRRWIIEGTDKQNADMDEDWFGQLLQLHQGTVQRIPDTSHHAHTLHIPYSWSSAETERWQIVILQAEGWGQDTAHHALLLFAIHNMLQDMLGLPACIHQQRIVVLTCMPAAGTDHLHDWQSMTRRMEHLLKCRVTAALSRSVQLTTQLHASYREALEACNYYPLLPGSTVWSYEQIAGRQGGQTVCSHEEERLLASILLREDTIALRGWVDRWMDHLIYQEEATPQSVQSALQSVLLSANRWLERAMSSMYTAAAATSPVEPAGSIVWQSGEYMKEELFQQLHRISRFYHTRCGEGPRMHVQKALLYIEENLGGDISLAAAARHVHLHASHLSEIFKKETGLTYSDWVGKRRMEYAAELLTISSAKVAEIAGQIGYEDVKYFSRLFKKYSGCTPTEYRERCLVQVSHPPSDSCYPLL